MEDRMVWDIHVLDQQLAKYIHVVIWVWNDFKDASHRLVFDLRRRSRFGHI